MQIDTNAINALLTGGIATLVPVAVFIKIAEWTIRVMFRFIFDSRTKGLD